MPLFWKNHGQMLENHGIYTRLACAVVLLVVKDPVVVVVVEYLNKC